MLGKSPLGSKTGGGGANGRHGARTSVGGGKASVDASPHGMGGCGDRGGWEFSFGG